MDHSSSRDIHPDKHQGRESEVRKRLTAMDETISQVIREWEASGELRRLQGRPIDLSDDSPEWFANRLLKQEGVSHPLIERGRDVEAMKADAEAVADRLRALARGLGVEYPAPSAVRSFNQLRDKILDDYRIRLLALNRGVLAYNLTVPDMLQKRQVSVGDEVHRLAGEIPALTLADPAPTTTSPSEPSRFWHRVAHFVRRRR